MLVVPEPTVPTTLVSVRHSEISKLRAWLRLAILGANEKDKDGGVGARCLRNRRKIAHNKAMEAKGWSISLI